jgi:hypothetical protein
VVTIDGLTREEVKNDVGEMETKTVLYFVEQDVKPLILNQINAQAIGSITGSKTAGEARGQKIELYNDETVMFGRKRVGGVRVRAVSHTPGGGQQQTFTPGRGRPTFGAQPQTREPDLERDLERQMPPLPKDPPF